MAAEERKENEGPSIASGKVLGPKDQFYFGPEGAWTGPTPEGGCMVYKVNGGKNGKLYVNHPDGTKQSHPPQSKKFYKGGAKAYVCGTTVHLPSGEWIEEV
jgi:hypothetical protein